MKISRGNPELSRLETKTFSELLLKRNLFSFRVASLARITNRRVDLLLVSQFGPYSDYSLINRNTKMSNSFILCFKTFCDRKMKINFSDLIKNRIFLWIRMYFEIKLKRWSLLAPRSLACIQQLHCKYRRARLQVRCRNCLHVEL